MTLFETDRLLIRQFTAADGDDFYLMSSDATILKYMRVAVSLPASKELLDEFVGAYKKQPRFGKFAVIEKSSGKYVGHFLLRPSSFMAGTETGVSFLQRAWGRGYATELTKGGLRFAFEDLHLSMVYAITARLNEAAQKVLLKCGFTQLPDFLENGIAECMFEIRSNLPDLI